MKNYNVTCIYTKAIFRGKTPVPADDNWQRFNGIVTCYSDSGIFSAVLKELQKKTTLKYIKINDLQYQEAI